MTTQDYLENLRKLLRTEYDEEKKAYQSLRKAIGIKRSAKRGDAWLGVRVGRTYWNSLNQLCIEIYRTQDEDIEHNFEFGKPVSFFTESALGMAGTVDGDINFLHTTGTVSYVDGSRMVVALAGDHGAAEVESQELPLGVCLSFDETSYRLMFEAMSDIISAKHGRLAYLRDLFHSPQQKTGWFTFRPIPFPWLNATQEEAVNKVLRAKDVMIVHGPPGTGKTTTLVEAIHETLRRESQVLVCAQSNMAVDWISQQLQDRMIPVLRIGNPNRVDDKMLSCTYEHQFASHPDYDQLWSIRQAIRRLYSQNGKGQSQHQQLDRLKSRAVELEMRIRENLFQNARVIACTLTGSANKVLSGMKFSSLFIDESAQALEPACWIAIRKAGRVILAGDHKQLPPTIKSQAAINGGLGRTLMERLVETHPEAVTLLQVQYRMNEAIMQFSSREFYHGLLRSAPEVEHRSILDLDTPIEWISNNFSVKGSDPLTEKSFENVWGETFVGESYGRINKAEAELTIKTLVDYVERIGRERLLEERIDIGIISPYRAQVQLLRRMVRQTPELKPLRSAITINTIDGFQGQERDVIILSMVRSNEDGQIGFLRDLRRMNVAITRARMKLIILGDEQTLTRHPFYRRLYDYIQKIN